MASLFEDAEARMLVAGQRAVLGLLESRPPKERIMKRTSRTLTVSTFVALGLLVPMLSHRAAISAEQIERVVAQEPGFSKLVVVKRPGPKPRPAPVPLLGVGLPAFAAAGMALAGYKLWRRRQSRG